MSSMDYPIHHFSSFHDSELMKQSPFISSYIIKIGTRRKSEVNMGVAVFQGGFWAKSCPNKLCTSSGAHKLALMYKGKLWALDVGSNVGGNSEQDYSR